MKISIEITHPIEITMKIGHVSSNPTEITMFFNHGHTLVGHPRSRDSGPRFAELKMISLDIVTLPVSSMVCEILRARFLRNQLPLVEQLVKVLSRCRYRYIYIYRR